MNVLHFALISALAADNMPQILKHEADPALTRLLGIDNPDILAEGDSNDGIARTARRFAVTSEAHRSEFIFDDDL